MRLLMLLSILLATAGFRMHAQALIPDLYGYTVSHSDSLDGPAYQWIDISLKGKQVQGLEDDLWVGPIEMEMDFPFYWYKRHKVWISDNGVIAFRPNPVIADLNPIGFPLLPIVDGREDLIAPFMTDLTFIGINNPGEVYTWADTATDRFVISYLEVPFFGNNALGYAGRNSFQVILDAKDSSITFQYAVQQGNIDPILQSRTYPFIVGIEDQTGSFGMTVWDSLPQELVAIRMDPPEHPLVEVRDMKSFWVANKENRGFFIPYVAPPNAPKPIISAMVGNIGSEAIAEPIEIQFRLDTELGFGYQSLDSLLTPYARGKLDTLQYALPFALPFPTTYTLSLILNNTNDINSKNDSLWVEMVVVDTFGGQPWFSYVTDMDEPARADGIEGRTDTSGNSGIGAYFRPFGNPIDVEAVEFFFSPYPDSFGRIHLGDGYRVEIYAESKEPRKPGDLLYSETILAKDVVFGKWVGMEAQPAIPIDTGGFYVAWIPLSDSLALLSESADASPPISRQTFEIQNGAWKPHRSDDTKDFWIRAKVNTSGLTAIDPELQDLSLLKVFPNPGDGFFFFEMQLSRPSPLRLSIFDVNGKFVGEDHFSASDYFHRFIDLRKMATGAYLLHFQYKQGHTSRWVKIQR